MQLNECTLLGKLLTPIFFIQMLAPKVYFIESFRTAQKLYKIIRNEPAMDQQLTSIRGKRNERNHTEVPWVNLMKLCLVLEGNQSEEEMRPLTAPFGNNLKLVWLIVQSSSRHWFCLLHPWVNHRLNRKCLRISMICFRADFTHYCRCGWNVCVLSFLCIDYMCGNEQRLWLMRKRQHMEDELQTCFGSHIYDVGKIREMLK